MSFHVSDNSINNNACYDILANMIQQNIDREIDVIVDIALPHNEYYNMFLTKINLEQHEVLSFLCGCSDDSVWLSRWEERLKNPLPNQYFKSIDDVVIHYAAMNIALLKDEVYIDSCNTLDENIDRILKKINWI